MHGCDPPSRATRSWSVFLSNVTGRGGAERHLENTHATRVGLSSLVQGKAPQVYMQKLTCLTPLPPTPAPPRGAAGTNSRMSCHLPREVWERLQLEAVLVKSCRRGALLQSLDMAGVTEQVVLQGVAAVAVFIIELQTAVLAVVALHMVVSVHGHDADGLI